MDVFMDSVISKYTIYIIHKINNFRPTDKTTYQ